MSPSDVAMIVHPSLTFGLQVADIGLQYIEEPVADPMADLSAFHCTTGVPVALDESVDEALRGRALPAVLTHSVPTHIGWGGETGIWTFLELKDRRPYAFTVRQH